MDRSRAFGRVGFRSRARRNEDDGVAFPPNSGEARAPCAVTDPRLQRRPEPVLDRAVGGDRLHESRESVRVAIHGVRALRRLWLAPLPLVRVPLTRQEQERRLRAVCGEGILAGLAPRPLLGVRTAPGLARHRLCLPPASGRIWCFAVGSRVLRIATGRPGTEREALSKRRNMLFLLCITCAICCDVSDPGRSRQLPCRTRVATPKPAHAFVSRAFVASCGSRGCRDDGRQPGNRPDWR